jgi:hypothetical protein
MKLYMISQLMRMKCLLEKLSEWLLRHQNNHCVWCCSEVICTESGPKRENSFLKNVNNDQNTATNKRQLTSFKTVLNASTRPMYLPPSSTNKRIKINVEDNKITHENEISIDRTVRKTRKP